VSDGEACARVDWGRRRSGDGCPWACRVWPEQEETAAEKCGSSARNGLLELAEQDIGIEVTLLRARDRKLRLCGERSTATRRWRPADARVVVARAGGHQGRGIGPGEEGGDAWKRSEQEVALRRR
jgi:hypothetical protein